MPHEAAPLDCIVPATFDEASLSLVQVIIDRIVHLKKEKKWKEADRWRTILRQRHFIETFCRNDGSIGWTIISQEKQLRQERIVWTASIVKVEEQQCHRRSDIGKVNATVPLIVTTVNLPHYRARLAETMDYLSMSLWEDGSTFFPVQSIDMLKLEDHLDIGANRIVWEGWRQILLPTLLAEQNQQFTIFDYQQMKKSSTQFFLVAEDDVRIAVSPRKLREVCSHAFRANPDCHILSLGHGYAPRKLTRRQRRRARQEASNIESISSIDSSKNIQNNPLTSPECPSSRSLFGHLKSGRGMHGSTLLAIRCPEGVQSLSNTLEEIPFGKRSHFDQFLFHSTCHCLGVAVSDPSLAGWAEVEQTLTSVGSGCRRERGGRLGYLPNICMEDGGGMKWIHRTVA